MKNPFVIMGIVLVAIIIIGGVIWFVSRNKNTATDTSAINPNATPVICNPNNPGYTMNGDFSIQCAGGTVPCQTGVPGYDIKGNLQSYCGVPCDPKNPAYDLNGNFNILCGGGARKK